MSSKTKTTGTDKADKSDKTDKADKANKRYQLFPLHMDEILPGETLMQLGTANLSRLKAELQRPINALYGKSDDNEDIWWRLRIYDNGDPEAITTLRCYFHNVVRALWKLQKDRHELGKMKKPEMPLLPCLRTPEWAQTIKDGHKRLLVYNITWAEVGVPRRLTPYKTRIAQITPTGVSPLGLPTADLQLQLLTRPSEEHWLLKDFGEPLEYDLRSQFLMTQKETAYFRGHPEELQLWTELCGGGDPNWSLSVEMQNLWQERLGNRRP